MRGVDAIVRAIDHARKQRLHRNRPGAGAQGTARCGGQPPRRARPVESGHFAKGSMKTYVCIVCGFVYDENLGRPEEGIPAGTLWDAVPADWSCPDCGAGKADFELVAI